MSAQPQAALPGVAPRMGAKALLELLHRHYIKPGPMPGGIFIPECGINGPGRQSRADALYVGFTSTSGRILVGHELKVSRSDWRKELDTAGKADFWADNCHQWWIVAPGPEIVPAEEVPADWGLLYPNPRTKTRMQVAKPATLHANRVPVWDATRSIMARLDTLHAQEMIAHRARVADEEHEKAEKQLERRLEAAGRRQLSPEQEERLAVIEQVEKLLGMPLTRRWYDDVEGTVTPARAAATLRLVEATEQLGIRDTQRWETAYLREKAEQVLAGLDGYEQARAALVALLTGKEPS